MPIEGLRTAHERSIAAPAAAVLQAILARGPSMFSILRLVSGVDLSPKNHRDPIFQVQSVYLTTRAQSDAGYTTDKIAEVMPVHVRADGPGASTLFVGPVMQLGNRPDGLASLNADQIASWMNMMSAVAVEVTKQTVATHATLARGMAE